MYPTAVRPSLAGFGVPVRAGSMADSARGDLVSALRAFRSGEGSRDSLLPEACAIWGKSSMTTLDRSFFLRGCE